jgi:predicted HTH domain antitoxin
MSIALSIPDTIVQAIRLPEEQIGPALTKELAISLYQQGYLSFGKARELAGLSKYEFGKLLGERGIPRHYTDEELAEDIAYARRE